MEQTQKNKTAKPYSPEFREGAVRQAVEHRDEYRSEVACADGDCRQIGLFAGQSSCLGPSGLCARCDDDLLDCGADQIRVV